MAALTSDGYRVVTYRTRYGSGALRLDVKRERMSMKGSIGLSVAKWLIVITAMALVLHAIIAASNSVGGPWN